MQERPSASLSLMACGIASGYSPPVLHGFEAQVGPVHMRVLWALLGRHLREFVHEFHQCLLATRRPQLRGSWGPLFCAGRAIHYRHDSVIRRWVDCFAHDTMAI